MYAKWRLFCRRLEPAGDIKRGVNWLIEEERSGQGEEEKRVEVEGGIEEGKGSRRVWGVEGGRRIENIGKIIRRGINPAGILATLHTKRKWNLSLI